MSEAPLSCRDVVELVTDALEGALSETTRGRFEEHMSACEACRTFARQIEQTVAVLRILPREGVAPLDDDLLRAFRRRGRGDGE